MILKFKRKSKGVKIFTFSRLYRKIKKLGIDVKNEKFI